MKDEEFPGLARDLQVQRKVAQTFQKSFGQVENILNTSKLLVKEIYQNHQTKTPDKLSRNVFLFLELNHNIKRVVDLYTDLSNSITKSLGPSSPEGGIQIKREPAD